MKPSPMQRSLEWLRGEGWFCWITEHWNCYARKRQDLWTIADLICLRGEDILAVQVTSASNVAARVRKINDCEHIGKIRKAGIQFHVHGWRKVKREWRLRIEDLS